MKTDLRSLHSESLRFAQSEVLRTRGRAQRALAHHEVVGDLPIPELQTFALSSLTNALRDYRAALGKRAFEIRQLA